MGNFWFQNDGFGPGHRRGATGRGQFALRSRIRRGMVGCLLAVLLLIGSAYYYYTRPARLIEFAEAYLSTLVEGQVRIGDAAFSIFKGIRLYDVTISPIDAAGIYGVGFGSDELPVFTCESLSLKHDPIAALTGRLSISQITATRTHFSFVADPLTGSLNLGRMLGPVSSTTDLLGRGRWLA
ncbi:MAG: hypothetical protein IID41_18110, partial [Planctomycetes bacterium]|nr:hypothetical protein [Planctomycetota bacterium]